MVAVTMHPAPVSRGEESEMSTTITARIIEAGNGLAVAGDEIYGPSTDTVYRIIATRGPIHTGQAGAGNYVWATIEDTGNSAGDLDKDEWDALSDCHIELPDERD